MSTYNHFEYGRTLVQYLPDFIKERGLPYICSDDTERPSDIDALINRLGDTVLMAIDTTSLRMLSQGDSLFGEREYHFAVLKKTTIGMVGAPIASREHAKSIVCKIISKMMNDRQSCTDTSGLRSLDPSKLRITAIGPVADYYHGVLLSFSISECFSY